MFILNPEGKSGLMKKRLLIGLVVVLTLILIGYVQHFQNGIYHCGQCGSERWVYNVLILDLGPKDFDEFGIEERG